MYAPEGRLLKPRVSFIIELFVMLVGLRVGNQVVIICVTGLAPVFCPVCGWGLPLLLYPQHLLSRLRSLVHMETAKTTDLLAG